MSEIADPPGIAIELIKLAAKDVGIEVNFKRLPNIRVLESLKANEIDGAFCYSYKEERKEMGQYPYKEDKLNNDYRITTVSYLYI